jgi:hypothetical protein
MQQLYQEQTATNVYFRSDFSLSQDFGHVKQGRGNDGVAEIRGWENMSKASKHHQ